MEGEKKRKECRKCGDELVIDETPKLRINGKDVGIADLDNTTISKELLQRVKDRDFVPPSVEREYSQALLEEYNNRI
jgi:hypothetical protein